MKKRNNNWFTLVELVITVTIIAILATVWFISYNWIIWNSKNSKVSSQMSQLSRSLELWKTEWINIFSFVLEENENTLLNPSISWTETSNSLYKAWKVNYLAMNYKKDNYEGNIDYRIWATKKLSTKHEIAWYIEDETLWRLAKITWNYKARTLSWTISEIDSINSNKITLIKNNWVKIWDTITSSWSTIITTIIIKIKSWDNYNDIIYTSVNIPIWTTHVMLANDETKWLIKWKDENSNTWVVVELWKYIP